MTTASSTLQDRRQRAADLRNLAAQCLGLSAVNRPAFAVKDDNLPGEADVIAAMTNDQGHDIIAVHFDLSEAASDRPTVSNAQARAANAAV